MQWYNEPPSWDRSDGKISIDARGETDFWRITRHDFVKDNGHFIYRDVSGDFTAMAAVAGEYGTDYDQAGLMVRDDEAVWMKCGIEYVDGVQQASAVVTRDVSDWSVVPLDDDPDSAWFRVERTGSTIEVYFSREGDEYTMLRQASLSDSDELQVGLMAAAPQGDGFQSTFTSFAIETV